MDGWNDDEEKGSPARGILVAAAVSIMLWLAGCLIVYALVVH
jgi:hypothetical protein